MYMHIAHDRLLEQPMYISKFDFVMCIYMNNVHLHVISRSEHSKLHAHVLVKYMYVGLRYVYTAEENNVLLHARGVTIAGHLFLQLVYCGCHPFPSLLPSPQQDNILTPKFILPIPPPLNNPELQVEGEAVGTRVYISTRGMCIPYASHACMKENTHPCVYTPSCHCGVTVCRMNNLVEIVHVLLFLP